MLCVAKRQESQMSRKPAEVRFFVCKHCGKTFAANLGTINRCHRMYGRDPLYCSRQCTGLSRRIETEANQLFNCLECGKEVPRRQYERATGYTKYYSQQKFCSQQCKAANQRTVALERFNRGEYKRHIKRHGYVWISVPSLVTGKKHAIMEHRWVMSQHLRRALFPEETVHHINGNRQDNRLENLELFTSRHGTGQRITDQIAFAIEMVRLYPEFATAAGVRLIDIKRDGEHDD